ncbi:hypothetical protein HMPREF1984_01813 [Leptotrichia sp. oral taxon 215 str. W9775]|nr:hypothetical protein HMPREF1984_01813 [Leptotrichia sp. oral taxon 215 str. W9775]
MLNIKGLEVLFSKEIIFQLIIKYFVFYLFSNKRILKVYGNNYITYVIV